VEGDPHCPLAASPERNLTACSVGCGRTFQIGSTKPMRTGTLVELRHSQGEKTRAAVLDAIGVDRSEIARMASEAILGNAAVQVLLPASISLPPEFDPAASLFQCGPSSVLEQFDARADMTELLRFHAGARDLRGLVVSCRLPAVLPSDPWVASQPLLVGVGDLVWATTTADSRAEAIADVVALSEGYPAGVIALHRGSAWSPHDPMLFAISICDGETFAIWSKGLALQSHRDERPPR
jgi:hypothetical protein